MVAPALDGPDERLRDWLARTEGTVEPGAKGWPPEAWGLHEDEVRSLGLRLIDLPTPVLTLDREALVHNVRRLARYCREQGVGLAPHAKTTMAPAVARLQLEEGAWGLTAATWGQARLLWASGCRRLLLANQVLEPAALRWLAAAAAAGGDLACFVDSPEAVAAMGRALESETAGSVDVLVEVGLPGGRTGARTVAEALAVAGAAARTPGLRLRGVAAYEGIAVSQRTAAELDRVRALLAGVRAVAERLLDANLFAGTDVLVSAGGSAAFDEVVEVLAPLARERPGVLVLLRSGCYASHDSVFYERVSPLAGRAVEGALRPALALYGRVLSRPEPGRAVADFGKRDTSSDLGMPVVRAVFRGGGRIDCGAPEPRVVELYDQHAVLETRPDHPLAAGDALCVGVSHPCTTFDRWRAVPVVEGSRVTGVLRTYF